MKSIAKASPILTAAMLLLTACETMEGLGRDTTKLGNDVTGSAKQNDLDNDPKN